MIDDSKSQKQQQYTLNDVNTRTWLKLVKLLDDSPDDEWEKIGQYFTNIFGPPELKTIRNNRLRKSPTESVLNLLKQNLVPIDRVYKCFVDLQLIEACNMLEELFPAHILFRQLTTSSSSNNTNKNNPTNNNTSSTSSGGGSMNDSAAAQAKLAAAAFTSSLNDGRLLNASSSGGGGGSSFISSQFNFTNTTNNKNNNTQQQQQQQQQQQTSTLMTYVDLSNSQVKTSSSSNTTTTTNPFDVHQSNAPKSNQNNKNISLSTTTQNDDALTRSLASADLNQIARSIAFTVQNKNGSGELDVAARALIDVYEGILPVLQEDTNNNDDSSNSNETLTNEFEVNLMLSGNFTQTEIIDRKLTFKKKEFVKVYDYLRELRMIKHVHLNLCVPVGILKGYDSQTLSLLYPAETRETKLLSDLAVFNYDNLDPSEYNVKQQLRIIKDVADALNYLHNTSDFKKNQIVHGNLSADRVLLELTSDGEYTAKIFDFTSAVDSTEISPEEFSVQLKNEMYRFGLIIFNVISWQSMDQNECKLIHFAEYDDLNIHKYQIYCQYKLDRQENDHVIGGLFRLFYKLTSPDYDASRGVNSRMILLFDNMIAGNA